MADLDLWFQISMADILQWKQKHLKPSGVSLDMFSVQGNTGPSWAAKESKAFWRGRDSRRERLTLVQMSRGNPTVLDARLTNMFFFPKDEEKYGEITQAVSFFDFFKYKYQVNIDGTVAAYRLPYLLAGDSVVLKQESPYYEHFYRDIHPGSHYVAFKRDLSDLLDKIQWLKDNDEEAKTIAKNAQEFVRNNLDPANILCYHVRLFQEYSKLLKNKPKGRKGFDLVEQPKQEQPCDCQMKKVKSNNKKKKVKKHDEL